MGASCCKRFSTIVFILLFILVLFSCSFRSTGVAIDEQLSEVDSLIALGDYNGAWSYLKKIAKTIKNPSDTLGVVRRALVLQRDDFAKSQLEDAVKNFSENQEILAVYTHMLMRENDYDKALPYAQKLEGGSYGSLYSELRFKIDERNLKEKNDKKKADEEFAIIDYYSEHYMQAYLDIEKSTGNPEYLRNATLIYALKGNMAKAFALHPESVTVYENPWFWAQISYDSHNFNQVISDLQLFELSSEELALLADAYVHLGLLEDARNTWFDSTSVYANKNPIAWHNMALYHNYIGDTKTANDFMIYVVSTFPEYVSGLAAYGQFSLFDSKGPSESMFTPLLREKGLNTLQMAEDALISYWDATDALLRMDEALVQLRETNNAEAMNLLIEKLKLEWESVKSGSTQRQKVSDIWNILEENSNEPYGYDPHLVQFAMWYFFTQGMIDEANGLFISHCTTKYSSFYESLGGFNNTPAPQMEIWEYEYGAYIYLKEENFDTAQIWLTHLMPNNIVSPATPIEAAINATTLYNATGRRALALSMYEQILSLVNNSSLKADIYYRMALIQFEMGDTKKASISLDEALQHDYNHSPSRLLRKKVTNN